MTPTGRTKERYNPIPTAREKAYHLWLMVMFPCAACCGTATCVHHPLKRHPDQRWRRDHEYVVALCDGCHRAIHAAGSEAKAFPGIDFAYEAALCRGGAITLGKL